MLWFGALWVALGCGDGTTPSGPDAGPEPAGNGPLEDGIVGRSCQPGRSACGPGGRCADELTGGAAWELLAEPLPAPHGYCTARCSEHRACGVDGLCFGRGLLLDDGECRRTCKDNQDCDVGQECAKASVPNPLLPNTCQPFPTPDQLEPGQAGKACQRDGDCGDGKCAEPEHPGGGYCTGLCIEDSDCGHGGTCVRGLYGSSGTCREACDRDSDCQRDRAGWGCGRDGLCVREADPLSGVGDACDDDSDCSGGSCRFVGLGGETYPDGYCVGRCDEDDDCGEHGTCVNGLTCLRACTDDRECRPKYACRVHPQAVGEDTTQRVCFPEPRDETRER